MRRIVVLLIIFMMLVLAGCGAKTGENADISGSDPEDAVGEVEIQAQAADDEPVAAVCGSGGYGYINTSGEWVIAPQYLEAYPFVNNVATVRTWENIWKIIDKKNDTIAEFPAGIEVDYASELDIHGFNSFTNTIYDDRIIIIDNNGDDKFYGVADTDGNIIITPQYERIYAYSEGLAVFARKLENDVTYYSYLDKAGNVAIDAYMSSAESFKDGLAWVQIFEPGTDMYTEDGFIDQTGALVITFHQVVAGDGKAYVDFYGMRSNFYEGVAAAQVAWADTSIPGPSKTASCLGLIDRDGKIIVKLRGYGENPRDLGMKRMEFSEGLCPFYGEYDGSIGNFIVGFMDTKGNIVIEPQREWVLDASNFSEGLCAVKIGGKYGYIDTTGTVVIPAQFAYASDFTHGFAVVKLSLFEWTFIDTNGNPVFELENTSGAKPFTK